MAQAAPLDAVQATQLLAKSHAINTKCSILVADQSQTLKDFLARAEISLAEKASVAVARKTIAAGRTQGKMVDCDDTAQKLVNDVFAAASAAAVAPIDDQTSTSEPETATTFEKAKKPTSTAVALVEPVVPTQKAAPIKLVKTGNKAKPIIAVKSPKPAKIVKSGNGLAAYESVAVRYYTAARCGNMHPNRINALYNQVLANHQQALAANRPRAVRAMLQSAEARAAAKRCI